MRGREVLMFAAGVLVGALLIGPIVWLMDDDVAPTTVTAPEEASGVASESTIAADVPRVQTPRVERERFAPAQVERGTDYGAGSDGGVVEVSDYDFPDGKGFTVHVSPSVRGGWSRWHVAESGNWWDAGASSPTPVATRALEQAEAAAKALLSTGEAFDEAAIRRLLASPEPESWEAGLALAAMHTPPLIDELAAVASDPSFGSMRVAAALAMSRLDPTPAALGPLLVELSRDTDAWVVMAAVQLFPEAREATAERAVEMLRDEPPDVLLAPLAEAAAGSSAVDALLESPPTTAIGFAVATGVSVGLEDHPRRRAAIRRLLARPGSDRIATDLFSTLTMLGSSEVLAEWYEARELPTATRVALLSSTVNALMAAPTADALSATERLVGSFARDLTDPDAPASLLLDGMAALGELQTKEAAYVDALWIAQSSHPSPFVREEARQRLRALGKGGSGELVIVSARYGAGEDWADVAHELSQLVIGPALRVRADNSIAGDPAPGHRKLLIVEYRYRGRLHRRVTAEDRILVLP